MLFFVESIDGWRIFPVVQTNRPINAYLLHYWPASKIVYFRSRLLIVRIFCRHHRRAQGIIYF